MCTMKPFELTRHRRPRRTPSGTMLFTLLLLSLLTASAMAHSVRCFATYDGTRISGYAWLGGGGRPHEVPYTVTDADGRLLHEGVTSERGEFSFEPAGPLDHVIRVTAGPGHVGTFTVSAAELGTAQKKQPEPSAPATEPSKNTDDDAPQADSGLQAAELADAVNRAMARQLAPLRRQIEANAARRRLQDVIGGVGYLVGIAGIAFYLLGRRGKA